MTVSSETRSVRHQGDGVTTLWAYSFLVPTSGEVLVRVYDTTTEAFTTISDSNYSITGVGDVSGGTITYPTSGSPLASTQFLYISRVVGYTQDMSISESGGFDSDVLEAQLDDIVFQIQQVKDAVAGAPTLQAPDAFTENLPPIDELKGKLLIFNSTTGNPEAGPTATDIADAQSNAAAAAASASAAATSATNAATSASNAATSESNAASAATTAANTAVTNSLNAYAWKTSVKAATTAAITRSGEQTIDGIALTSGDRCLVKDQGVAANNGIFIVAAGTWTRATDADAWDELVQAVTVVQQGTTLGGKIYRCNVVPGGTLETTDVNWVEMLASGVTASDNTTFTGNITFSSGLTLPANITVPQNTYWSSGNSVEVRLNKNASTQLSRIWGQTNSVDRWAMDLGDATAESGSDAGSNFIIKAYDDSGTLIGNVIRFRRSDRQCLIYGNTVIDTGNYLGFGAGAEIHAGSGTPEGSQAAPVGSLYLRTDGGSGTTIYAKESGAGNTGWSAL